MHLTLAMAMASHFPAASSGKKSGGSSAYSLLILVGIFAIAYFVMIRPARRRQRMTMTDRGNCEVGDEVTTTAGLLATVVAIDDDAITLEIAPGVHSRFLKSAIVKVNYPPNDEDDLPDHEAIEHEASEHEASEPESVEPEAVEHERIDHETVDQQPTNQEPIESEPIELDHEAIDDRKETGHGGNSG